MWSSAVRPSLSLVWVMRLQTYTLVAAESRIASGIPHTSRFGIRLVKSEPGPTVIKSARAIAAKVCGSGSGPGGTRNNSDIRPLLAVMLVSPLTREPSSINASNSMSAVVAG